MNTENRIIASGIAAHGKQGWLIVRLQRYALIGWILFMLLAMVFVAFIFIDKLKPVPVLAVNEAGQLLGKFEYLSPTSRTDAELIAGVRLFHQQCLSINSNTIFDDYAACLNMMSDTLREQKIIELKKIGYLSSIAKANSRSYLVFDDTVTPIKILKRDELTATVQAVGNIVIDTGQARKKDTPFDITVELTIVPRSQLSTYGFEVTRMVDN